MKCTISGGLPVKSIASERRIARNAALSRRMLETTVQISRARNFCFL